MEQEGLGVERAEPCSAATEQRESRRDERDDRRRVVHDTAFDMLRGLLGAPARRRARRRAGRRRPSRRWSPGPRRPPTSTGSSSSARSRTAPSAPASALAAALAWQLAAPRARRRRRQLAQVGASPRRVACRSSRSRAIRSRSACSTSSCRSRRRRRRAWPTARSVVLARARRAGRAADRALRDARRSALGRSGAGGRRWLVVGAWIGVATDHTASRRVARHAQRGRRRQAEHHPHRRRYAARRRRAHRPREQAGRLRRSSRADGVVFERTYSQASWTRPSIATILTARVSVGARHRCTRWTSCPTSALHARRGAARRRATGRRRSPPTSTSRRSSTSSRASTSSTTSSRASTSAPPTRRRKLAVYKGLRAAREKVLRARCGCRTSTRTRTWSISTSRRWLGEQTAGAVLPLHPLHGSARSVLRDSRTTATASRGSRRPTRRRSGPRSCTTSITQDVRYLDGYLQRARRSAEGRAGSTTAASSPSPPITARSSTSTAAGGTARRCTKSRCTCR